MKRYPSDTVKLLSTEFPKFSKITLCYVNNPEYGVDISPEAKRWFNRMKFGQEMNADGELTEEEAEIVQQYLEEHYDSIRNLIVWMALEHEAPMHERVSRP